MRFFEAIGGVPGIGRTDRMGQLGRSRSKGFTFHPVALAFARHHDLAFKACHAGTPSAKGRSSVLSGISNAVSSPKPTSTHPRTSAS